MQRDALIIGAGLAGSEAAFQLANRGWRVELVEMRPLRPTEVHSTDQCAELVCSNSFRSDDPAQAIGLLHEELRRSNSLIMRCGDAHRIPAGSALAVDRDGFAAAVTQAITEHPRITLTRGEVSDPVEYAGGTSVPTLIATGPLTSDGLAQWMERYTGKSLAFYDAIAPIVYKDTIDMDIAWFESRWQRGEGKDYINCPLDREQYANFIEQLRGADQHEGHDWENIPFFEGCLPVEEMAARGVETLRFGPMKPIGLLGNPSGEKPYAVVQLRQDNALGTLYNIVGFQTRLKHPAQKEVFRTIPGLGNAEFARLGGIHRNSFINAPQLLDRTLALQACPHIRFAGQITGVEGYIESTAMGYLAALFMHATLNNTNPETMMPPPSTALGGLLQHITTPEHAEGFQPMNINFGLLPPIVAEGERTANGKIRKLGKKDRRRLQVEEARRAYETWTQATLTPDLANDAKQGETQAATPG